MRDIETINAIIKEIKEEADKASSEEYKKGLLKAKTIVQLYGIRLMTSGTDWKKRKEGSV